MAKLRVHNIEPSTGTDVAFGTTGDTIAVSSDSLKLNTWKDSGGNTLFQSDGAGTLSNVNSTFSGAGPKLILSQTASDSEGVAFTSGIDSNYDKYMFVFTDIACSTDNKHFQFQCRNYPSSSTYDTTITSTCFQAYNPESGAGWFGYRANGQLSQETGYQALAEEMGNGSDESSAGILYLFNPASTTYVKQFYSRFAEYSFESRNYDEFVSGYLNTTGVINGINFRMSSGNFDGKIKMYGVV